MYYDQDTRSIVDLSPVEGGWEINRIKVTPGAYGKGIGRKLMAEVLTDADQEQTTLYLYVNPYGALDWDALTSWYHRLGFETYLTEQEMGYGDSDTICEGALRRKPVAPQPRPQDRAAEACGSPESEGALQRTEPRPTQQGAR